MPFRDIRVLIVEDDGDLRRAIAHTLQVRHYQIRQADSAEMALDQFKKADIMILDLRLPDMAGEMLITQWHKNPDAGPLIVMSGFIQSDEQANELIDLGAWCIIYKGHGLNALEAATDRFAQTVLYSRMAKEVSKLKMYIAGMAITIAALGGIEVIPWLFKIFGVHIPGLL